MKTPLAGSEDLIVHLRLDADVQGPTNQEMAVARLDREAMVPCSKGIVGVGHLL